MSYDGRLVFGLLGDYDALPDLDDVAADLEARSTSWPRPPGSAATGAEAPAAARRPKARAAPASAAALGALRPARALVVGGCSRCCWSFSGARRRRRRRPTRRRGPGQLRRPRLAPRRGAPSASARVQLRPADQRRAPRRRRHARRDRAQRRRDPARARARRRRHLLRRAAAAGALRALQHDVSGPVRPRRRRPPARRSSSPARPGAGGVHRAAPGGACCAPDAGRPAPARVRRGLDRPRRARVACHADGRSAAPCASRSPRSTPRRRPRGQRRARSRERIERARDGGAELVLLPELAITGYPPEDLLLREHFLRDAREALDGDRRAASRASSRVVGFPERAEDVFNSIAVLADGESPGDLPQDAAVELRRRRRGALLPGRRRRRGARPRRGADRPDDLRGPVGARARPPPTRRWPARR